MINMEVHEGDLPVLQDALDMASEINQQSLRFSLITDAERELAKRNLSALSRLSMSLARAQEP